MAIVLQLFVNTLVTAAMYALVASGLSFIYATCRVFHLAHGFTVAVGAFAFWLVVANRGGVMWLGALAAVIAAVIVGTIMNEVVYERLRAKKVKGSGVLVATIALLMFGGAFLQAIFGAQPKTLGVETMIIHLGPASMTQLQLGIILTAIILLTLLALFLRYTKFGKAMRATADNEIVAEVLGIKTRLVRRLTFAIGSALGAVAGVAMALEFNADPNMGVMAAIKGFTAVVIGGAGSMAGVLLGSVILGGAEQAAVWFAGSGWKNAVAFVLLFVFLLIRPRGIFGRKWFV